MIDGRNTTFDWQRHPGRICVFAVGAFEQHSHHLPLETDRLEGDFFARIVADELDAALLPTLPFGTSLEQTGFRGTLTLHPETLMQVVRDVADEVTRQGFTRLVLINAHGGNHCLVPVVRDINRLDGPLKIVLVNFWEFSDPDVACDSRAYGPEIHAGEWETSLMLALAPESVGSGCVDMDVPADDDHPLRQSDLSMVGMGRLAPAGAVGWPSYASAAKGEQIVASIKRNLVAHVRDRLARLDAIGRYAGAGGIALRGLLAVDIPAAMRLKDSVGWNQLPSDWELYLLASPDGCLVAVCSGQVVGTITAINHAGRCGWIGMVVVDAAFRRLGIATHLMSAALELLRDCRCVKLDATALGLELYTRLGFAEEGVVQRVAGLVAAGLPEPGAEVTKVTAADLDAITQLDTAAFGVSRRALLASLLDLAPQVSWKIEDNSGVCGFCLGRPGQNFFRLGPITAADLRRAQQVTLAALRCLRGRRVVVDIPPGQDAFRAWLEDMGFAVGGEFVRMVRGQSIGGAPARYFAIMGGEFG